MILAPVDHLPFEVSAVLAEDPGQEFIVDAPLCYAPPGWATCEERMLPPGGKRR